MSNSLALLDDDVEQLPMEKDYRRDDPLEKSIQEVF